MVTIEEEVAAIAADFPNRVPHIIKAIKEGRITGAYYGIENCGCIYGHTTTNPDNINMCDAIDNKDRIAKRLGYPLSTQTPVEAAVNSVECGQKPADTPILQRLLETLERYQVVEEGNI